MFKFDFAVEEDAEDLNLPGPSKPSQPVSTPTPDRTTLSQACHHLTLDDLLSTLPETISYSPLAVPGIEPILRRDLFDARFQLSQDDSRDTAQAGDTGGSEGEEEYVDSGTDLIPGLYEGGLKTWEGGVDLVEVISRAGGEHGVGSWVSGSRVLEIGCGTALPTAYLLGSLLSMTKSESEIESGSGPIPTTLHLQDYNKPVLSLVSLPNLLLAALPYLPPDILHQPEDEVDVEETIPDLTQPGVLPLTPEVKNAFKELLDRSNIELKFTYGHWNGLAQELSGDQGYELIMTAETIYNEESVDDLISVLRNGSKEGMTPANGGTGIQLEESLEELKVRDKWDEKPLREQSTLILVAAKVLYFGVGGGIQDFLKRVKISDGWWDGVQEWTRGVARKVVRISWD